MSNADIVVDGHTFAAELLLQPGGHFRVFEWKQMRPVIDDGHIAAITAEDLSKFAGDRPPANDDQTGGEMAEIEDRFTRQTCRLVQSGDIRDDGAPTGGNDSAGEMEFLPRDIDRLRAGKPGLTEMDVNSVAGLKPFN